MITPIEFYTTPEGEVTLRPMGQAERQLTEHDTGFIQDMLTQIAEFYPTAHKALMEIYSKSAANKQYRDYLAVRRFIKCNFGVYDNQIDVDANGTFNFEFVSCPLRGECKWDGVLCQPKFNSQLSSRQLEVMQMCYNGERDEDIAEKLFISLNTIQNHRKAVYKKLGVHNMREFMKYAADNNIFKSRNNESRR